MKRVTLSRPGPVHRAAIGLLVLLVVPFGAPDAPVVASGPQSVSPLFRAAVDLVTLTAVVRDRNGRVVPSLEKDDFLVLDRGIEQSIVEFGHGDEAGASVALLIDVSGSMRMASKLTVARRAAERVLAHLNPARDEVALFSFDRELRELQPFTHDLTRVHAALELVQPFGSTSLYDAIASTARVAASRSLRRASVVVLTDGVDTASRLSAAEVSGIASSIAVPVYLVASVSPLDDPRGAAVSASSQHAALPSGDLEDLARWTGGGLFWVTRHEARATWVRQLVAELSHRYVIGFEATGPAGWHPIEIRVRRGRRLTVRTRGGYMADANAGAE